MNIEEMTLEQINEELSLLKKKENSQHASGRYGAYDGANAMRQKQLMVRKQKLALEAKKA